jgi:hypothetical protein
MYWRYSSPKYSSIKDSSKRIREKASNIVIPAQQRPIHQLEEMNSVEPRMRMNAE